MTLKKWIQIVMIGASMVTLAACSGSKAKMQDDLAINDANSPYYEDSSDAQSSGLGEETNFGEKTKSHGMAANGNRTYYFDFDSNAVHDADKPAIEANAQKIASSNKKVMLEGHTDPRGSREYNIGLGERRAKAVAQIMTSKGVNRNQIRIVSYGAEKLASEGHSEAEYQRDRRGVLVYLQ